MNGITLYMAVHYEYYVAAYMCVTGTYRYISRFLIMHTLLKIPQKILNTVLENVLWDDR